LQSNREATPVRGKSEPHVIDPHAVYTLESARTALGLAKACLPREIRLGRLKVAKRAGRYFVLGSWLLAWIEDGEIKRGQRKPSTEVNGVAGNAKD
jgi:hypothetical protein